MPGNPRPEFELTDYGNAKRLVARHGENLRYVSLWNEWLLWDGYRWCRDETEGIMRCAKDTVCAMYQESVDTQDSRHAIKSAGEANLRHMIVVARSEPGISVTPGQLDANPMVLNCLNGTLDFCEWELRKHRREDLITKLVQVLYEEDSSRPSWEKFLDRVMGGNARLIRFVQRAIGYSLTGRTSEQVLFMLHGEGANGKSTFLETIGALMGDYGMTTPPETLLKKDSGAIRNDIARLKGARFVSSVEPDEGKSLAISLVKQMTGEDTISARFLYSESFQYKPEFKVFLATNHLPVIRDRSLAIWRRIRIIPFNVTIPEQERDRNLRQKLNTELPGILVWALQGCREYLDHGLNCPEEVTEATASYQTAMNPIAGFIDECCLIGLSLKVNSTAFFGSFEKWCARHDQNRINRKEFGLLLQARGFLTKRSGSGGEYEWHGITLANTY